MSDRDGRTPLHHAAFDGDTSEVERLLKAGSDPNAADADGFTALHLAAQQGSLAACALILDKGAEVDCCNRFGNTPLWIATFNSRGNGEIIGLLRRRGADPGHLNEAGRSPVELARTIGNYPVAQFYADLP